MSGAPQWRFARLPFARHPGAAHDPGPSNPGSPRRRRWEGALLLSLSIAGLAGCGPSAPSRVAGRDGRPVLQVNVLADTSRSLSLASPPPRLRVSLARVEPSRGGAEEPPLPAAGPDTLVPTEAAAASSPRLSPPIRRRPGTLLAPPRLRRAAVIELDVRVDVFGRVAEVRWTPGDADTALVRAVERCAAGMEFYPALLDGRPVDVWCRQRFEFAPR